MWSKYSNKIPKFKMGARLILRSRGHDVRFVFVGQICHARSQRSLWSSDRMSTLVETRVYLLVRIRSDTPPPRFESVPRFSRPAGRPGC